MTQTTPTRDEAVPTGWQTVPTTATRQMLDAFFKTMILRRPLSECWAAALASAPAPASGGVDAVAWKQLCRVLEIDHWHDTSPDRVVAHVQHVSSEQKRLMLANDALEDALSPAATPMSEAGGEPIGWIGDLTLQRLGNGQEGKIYPTDPCANASWSMPVYLAKPASSPAGGDVALVRAVKRAMENAGTLPAKEAVKLVPADWHRICDLVLSASQSTSAGRVE